MLATRQGLAMLPPRRGGASMDYIELSARIKKLAIIAMFSDDDLMERLVLKGGNLLDLVYEISTRPSIDIDLSMEGDFEQVSVFAKRSRRCWNRLSARRAMWRSISTSPTCRRR
jgi:predicted nucleotidyltransferase component of viral defense system